MNEEKVLMNTEDNENHENDDMVADVLQADGESTISFKVDESARPQHTWTKKQKRTVWIAAVVAVVLFIVISFLLSLAGIDVMNLLGGNPAMN